MIAAFSNEPAIDFANPQNRKAMEEALATVRSQFGTPYPLIIGGEAIMTSAKMHSINPSRPTEIVSVSSRADAALADKALDAAWQAFSNWRRTSVEERARTLIKAAAIMRRRKFELSATMVYEAGKTWPEADGDVAEAIDFIEYYARSALSTGSIPVGHLPGEEAEAFYQPIGVGIIIPPWNFPLAILTGMTTAAVVAGNAVVLKPASPTTTIAAKFMEIMQEASIPPGVINYLPGDGAVIGDHLVSHPRTRFISFTGSRDVGLRINALAAQHREGQRWIKRVIAEMGGKDAILVDETADLDAAAEGIVASAFSFQGQKCSACSRAVIVESVYDAVLERVAERVKTLRLGAPEDVATDVGPVIDERAQSKILSYMDIGRSEAKLISGGHKASGDGYFLQPTVFGDVDPGSRLGQEEIFGPVLSCIRARDFEHGLEIVNGTEYGLTGSLYSHDRERIERARHEFEVGNLYINRKCTGAVVGVHPFGGFNMSGTDSKTGSPDYLLQFLQGKSVAERY